MKNFKVKLFLIIALGGAILSSCSKSEDAVGSAQPSPTPPAVSVKTSTTAASAVTLKTAVLGGSINDYQGSPIIERGVCYNTTPNPTISNNKILMGAGQGTFSDTIRNLTPNTTYFARAFRTNSSGTEYGNEITLRTFSSARLRRIYKEGDPLAYSEYTYNNQGKLIKYFSNAGGGTQFNYVDTFIYNSNNVLIKSAYNLGNNINLAAPYSQTLYTVSGQYPVSSQYFLGTTNLVTQNSYSFDTLGKLLFLNTTVINGTYAGIPTHSNTFTYDAFGNLDKVYYKQPGYAQYIITQYSNYDTKANPFYGLPWYYDFEIYLYNDSQFSKNNAGTIARTQYGGGVGYETYSFDYNADGLVSKKRNGNNPSGIFVYEYQ